MSITEWECPATRNVDNIIWQYSTYLSSGDGVLQRRELGDQLRWLVLLADSSVLQVTIMFSKELILRAGMLEPEVGRCFC